MKKFLVTYHAGGPSPQDEASMQKIREAFGAWLQRAGSAVSDPGAPVRVVGRVARGQPAPAVEVGGYSIVQGDSYEAVQSVLAAHPFVARGGTLQVAELV